MQNLRDKLLKAGLITQSDQPERDPEPVKAPQRSYSPPSGQRPSRRGPPREAPIPRLPPLAVPNNKEFQRLEAKRQVELDRKIRERVLAVQVPVEPGDHTFYFVTRKNRLRRLEMTQAQAERLEKGELAVVERPDPGQIEHALVPAAMAEELMTLQPKGVRFFNKPQSPVGFLSDEELDRRQKVESERVTREANAAEKAGVLESAEELVPATAPEDAEESGATAEAEMPEEQLAATAERTSAHLPGAPDESES